MMKNKSIRIILLFFSITFLLWGCHSQKIPITHVILLTIDTLRADHLGTYGYIRPTSPFLDSLAEKGVLFKNAFASSSHTAPSHASIFTSLHPTQHRLLVNGESLHTTAFTMAEMFQETGYETAGFCSVGFLNGVNQGFDVFDNETYKEIVHYRRANHTIDRALDFLNRRKSSDKFFMWIHLFDPHRPYHPPKDCLGGFNFKSKAERDGFIHFLTEIHKLPSDYYKHAFKLIQDYNNYDSEILFVDQQIKRLFHYMEKRKFNSKTLWIITADHGEGLGNHHYDSHGKYIYREQVHVPLIFYFGNKLYAHHEEKKLVRHVDIFPSLCEILGFSLGEKIKFLQGDSLFPLTKKEKDKRTKQYAFYERRPKDQRARKKWEPGKIYGMQTLRYKYIFHSQGRDEFYDLLYDPYESKNLIEYESKEKRKLKKILRLKYDLLSKQTLHDSPSKIDKKHLQELKTLGYIH